jgi:hypothetical protein
MGTFAPKTPAPQEFRYATVSAPNGGHLCNTMLDNHMQCTKKVTKFVTVAGRQGCDYCEAHFQIELAAAQRAGLKIVNANDSTGTT